MLHLVLSVSAVKPISPMTPELLQQKVLVHLFILWSLTYLYLGTLVGQLNSFMDKCFVDPLTVPLSPNFLTWAVWYVCGVCAHMRACVVCVFVCVSD